MAVAVSAQVAQKREWPQGTRATLERRAINKAQLVLAMTTNGYFVVRLISVRHFPVQHFQRPQQYCQTAGDSKRPTIYLFI